MSPFFRTEHRPEEKTRWAVTQLRALRPDGTELWPGRNDIEIYRQIYAQSPAHFMAIFQQDPSAMTGDIFKPGWLKWWVPGDALNEHGVMSVWRDANGTTADQLIEAGLAHIKLPKPPALLAGMGIDLALSKKETADFTAMVVGWMSTAGELFVNHVQREHLTSVEGLRTIKELSLDFKIKAIGIEKDNLELVMEQLQGLVGVGHMPWRALELEGDKVLRARPLQAAYQMGKVYHRYGMPWNAWFEAELLSFPKGVHDDLVDAAGALLETLRGWRPGQAAGFQELLKELRTPDRWPTGV